LLTELPPPRPEEELDTLTRVVHLGLMVFGVLAWLTGKYAGDYKYARHLGFSIHRWLGMGLAISLVLRLLYGLLGPANVRFTEWFPHTRERLILAWQDVLTLLRFQLPERPRHQGLYGLVHAFGLAAFAWMALTGSLMFFFLPPGRKAGGLLHIIKEVHEVGWWLIGIFLALHLSGVLLHVLFRQLNWRRMFFLKD
jgi:cytochrome b